MRAHFTALTASLLFAAASADRTQCERGLCLTSFRYCDETPCKYPEDVYPLFAERDSNGGYNMINADNDYLITWKNAKANFPVMIQWSFDPSLDAADDSDSIKWATNVTGSSEYKFNPGKILDDFPHSRAQNNSALALRTLATTTGNIITISQPEFVLENPDAVAEADVSNQFMVSTGRAFEVIEAHGAIVRREEKARWTKYVGIGVGVGVPVLVAVVTFVTWKMATRAALKWQAVAAADAEVAAK